MPNKVEAYVKRELFNEVCAHLDQQEITLITGSRQVGKTVLLNQSKEYLIKEQKIAETAIFSYNLDLIQDWELLQDQTAFIEFLKVRSREQKIYVFVDEAQKVPEAARFFKGVYDVNLNVKLILTGSSSLELKAKFKETLVGRKRVFLLSPFTFFEFVSSQDSVLAEILKSNQNMAVLDQRKLLTLFKEYLVFGGYPRVVLTSDKEEKQNILKEIYSSYVEKDAVGLFEVKNKTAFNRLIKLLAVQIGQLVNVDELATHLAIDRYTVDRYILALEETFILKKLSPYFRNPRQEIIKAGKIYFLDSGLRNLALENFEAFDKRVDKGSLLENAVLTELIFSTRNQFNQIHFWRTKQKTEVDFIIEKGQTFLPVEVKITPKKAIIPAGLANFISKFYPNQGYIVNCFFNEHQIIQNGTIIQFIYPFELSKHV